MDTSRTTLLHSKRLGRKELCLPCSRFKLGRCFFFLIIIFLILIIILGLAAIIMFFILKPQKPLFSVEAAKIESYKLDLASNNKQDLLVSTCLSLTLNASNPNRDVAISYTTSRLHVLLEDGIVIGMIKVPRLHQPPHTKNISVQAKVVLERVNISEIITSGKSMIQQEIRILGDVKAQVQIFQLTLPKLRIALECDIKIDPKYLTFNYEMISSFKAGEVPTDMISRPNLSHLFSNKCSAALYI